jgi:hypothetical protein
LDNLWQQRNSQKSPRESGHLRAVLRNLEQSGDVILPATTNAVGLVEKVIAVAERFRGVLIDGNGDRLDVLVALSLARR